MTNGLQQRRDWFDTYFPSTDPAVVRSRPRRHSSCCPVCGYPTLYERGSYEICHLCHWEDDGQDDPDLGVRGGPNGDYSLAEARQNREAHRTIYRPNHRGAAIPVEALRSRRPDQIELEELFDRIQATDMRNHHELILWRRVTQVSGLGYEPVD